MDKHYYFTIEESLKACREAGFENFDLNFHTASLPGGPLEDDKNWEKWVESIALLKKEMGINTPYAHTHFYVLPQDDKKEYERHEELLLRSIDAAGRLGVEWIVVHPYSARDDAWYSRKKSLEHNVNAMRKYAKKAKEYPGLGLAIENMVEDRKSRRFGSSAEDLIELFDALDDPIFGFCWDIGHGVRSNIDTASSLRQLGKNLKVVHVHDTNVDSDHTLPFLGQIDWASIMPVMKEIGYEGYWNYESQNYTRYMPPEVRKEALRLAYKVNEAMIKMAE